MFQDAGKLKLGLWYALRFHQAKQQQQQRQQQQQLAAASSSSRGSGGGGADGDRLRPALGGIARSEGLVAEPHQLEQWLLSLSLGLVAAELKQAAAVSALSGAAAAPEAAAHAPPGVVAAAEVIVSVCLLLSRHDILFGSAFALFAQHAQSTGDTACLGALLECVEAAVLSDQLPGLAPEVMQARMMLCSSD